MLDTYHSRYFLLLTFGCLVLTTGICFSCNEISTRESNSQVSVHERQKQRGDLSPEADPAPSLKPAFFEFLSQLPNGLESWERFMDSGRYRIANESDFKFPASFFQGDAGGKRFHVQLPVSPGDINDDELSHDLAIIVVDTTNNNENRFGIVIFNQDENPEVIPQPTWLFQERNLSKTIFGYSRDGLAVRTYKEDGTFDVCHARWDKRNKQYSCK